MALYMTQFAYTPSAWAALAKSPENRRTAISGLVEKAGGKLVELYYCFGEYDGLVIFEAPDDVAAASVAVGASMPGHLKAIKTTRLLTVEETMDVMRRAGGYAYSAPAGTH